MPKRNGEKFSFADEPPPKTEPQQPDHAQRMLDFLLRWPRPSISTSDLMIYGPRPKKNAEEVLRLATILEKHGWLTKKDTPKKNMRHWNINRRQPVVRPTLDS